MSHKIGDRLEGLVTSVTDFGLFVELEEYYVDGLVHITSLGQDYYRFDADRRQLIGESSGKVYKTGDKLEIQVARVDMEQGRIDFALTEVVNDKHRRSGKPASRHARSYAQKSNGAKSYSKSKKKRRK